MLEEQTKQMVEEFFASKDCRHCNHPAQRLWRNKYYCRDCFPGERAFEIRVHRLVTPKKN